MDLTAGPYICVIKNYVYILFESLGLGFHQIVLEKRKDFTKILSSLNVSWAPNQPIQIISEGSCDTENWKNAC